MARKSGENADIGRTLGDTDFGSSLKDFEPGDISRGFCGRDVEDGFERSNNDGRMLAYEENGHDPFEMDPDYTEEEMRPGFLERPGQGYSKSNVRRN